MVVAWLLVINEGPELEVTVKLEPKPVRPIDARARKGEPCLVVLSTNG